MPLDAADDALALKAAIMIVAAYFIRPAGPRVFKQLRMVNCGGATVPGGQRRLSELHYAMLRT